MSSKIGFGEILKKRREELGKTLNDVYSATKLNTSIIQALEEEWMEKLPAPIYVINFIKIYSKYLNIGFEELENKYLNSMKIDREKFYFGEPTKKDVNLQSINKNKVYYYIVLFSIFSIFIIYLFENFGLLGKIFKKKTKYFNSKQIYEISVPFKIKALKPTPFYISNRGVKIFESVLTQNNTYYFNVIQGYIINITKPENTIIYLNNDKIETVKNTDKLKYIVNRNINGKLYLKKQLE